MTKRKILPTSARAYVPPEFIDHFIAKGWRPAEHAFGKKAAERYRSIVGRERLDAAHKQFLADQKRDPKVDIAQYRIVLKRQRAEAAR